MFDESLIKCSFLGRDGYRWFIGQVPPASAPTSDVWGERVPIRVFGHNTGDGSILGDADLAPALIAKSPTGGFDNRQSSGIVGGETVIGFFVDGDNGQQPCITGIIDRYTDESGITVSDALQNNSTGFKSVNPVSYHPWRVGVTTYTPNPSSLNDKQGLSASPKGKSILQVTGDDKARPELSAVSFKESLELAEIANGPSNCGDDLTSRIQVELTKLTEILKGIKKYYQLYVVQTANTVTTITDQLQQIINNIAAVMRTLVQRVRNFILRKLRNLLRDALDSILGDVLKDIKDSIIGKIFDALFCAFQDVIDKLPELIADFIAAIIGRFFAAPICAAEQFINAILNNLIKEIDDAIQPIISEINDILSGILEVGGQIIDAIDQVLGVLGFLCYEKECYEITKFKASAWAGPSKSQKDNYENFLKEIELEDISDDAVEWLNASGFSLEDDFSIAGQGVLGRSSCDTLPVNCGPPFIDIFGGRPATEALASAVVNQAGQVIGAVLENAGFGYVQPPFITFRDPCGNGRGAAGYGVINFEFGTLERIIITNPGYGYLSYPNGKTSFDPVDPPGSQPDPREVVTISTGEKLLIDPGKGNTVSSIDTDDASPGSPVDGDDPNAINLVPVVGCLDDITIINTGFGYDQNDEIIIVPEVPGLELKAKYTEVGQLVKIDISGQTCGFTDVPEIRINSPTGSGAEVRATLTFTKATEFEAEERQRYKDSILQVVQCISS